MAFPRIIPWYMYILKANLLITSPFSPGDISDQKNILFAETTIPGLSYSPISTGGFNNRKISFSIQAIKRDNVTGNTNILKLYEILRNPFSNISDIFNQSPQFTQNPKVIYNYGIGSVPLIWYVTKCDFVHKGNWTNAIGNPRFSDINIELTLDETDFTNQMEKTYRQFLSIIGSAQGVEQITLDTLNQKGF